METIAMGHYGSSPHVMQVIDVIISSVILNYSMRV